MASGATIHPFPERTESTGKATEGKHLAQVDSAANVSGLARWRTDLKWVFGIPFTMTLGVTLTVLALFLFTSAGSAQGTIAAMNAPLVSEPLIIDNGLSASAPGLISLMKSPDFAQRVYQDSSLLNSQIAAIPDGPTQPDLTVEGAPADGQNPDVVEQPGQGVKGMISLYASPVKILSGEAHSAIGALLFAAVLFSLMFGIPFIVFSRGFGRLVSAGISLAVASWVPFVVFSLAGSRLTDVFVTESGADAASSGNSPDAFGMPAEDAQGRIIRNAFRPFVESAVGHVNGVFGAAALLAIVCFVAAAAGYLVRRSRRRLRAV